MIFTADKLKEARDSGYSDEEIWGYVSSSDDRFNSAKSEGYSLDEVATFFSSQKPADTSFTDKLQTATEELEMTIADIPLALGEAFSGLTKTAPASFYAAKEGLARPDQYSKEALAAFDTQREYFKQLEQQAKTREAEGKSTAVGEAIRGAGQSLGFTVAGMAPAIAGGAITGAAASALFPPAASATIPIGAIAGGIGSMVASAPVSYRMAGGQFLYDAFKELEESKGSPLTEEEKTKAYNELLPIAQNTALWEAGPEAIGNAVQLGALKYAFGFGKKAATNVAGQAIEKSNNTLLKKVGAVAGGQAIELAGETITQTQQGADQAKMEQYVQTGSTAGAPDEYQGLAGAVKAFKEVAPTTLALGAITAGAGGAVKVVGMGGKQVGKVLFSKPKTPEQIAEDQINDAANKVANDLSISPDDTQANNLNQQIKALSEVQEIRKQTLAAIEPTSREAQTLKLDIAEGESMLGELNQNLTKLTGLSEPITEANRQQAELAKAIVEEPTIAEAAPTEAAPEVSAIKPQVQVTNIDSLIDQGGGIVAVQEDGRDVKFKQFGLIIDGDSAEVAFVEIDPSESGRGIGLEAYRSLGNELAVRGITLRSSGAQYSQGRDLWLKLAQQGNARLNSIRRFEFVAKPTNESQGAPAAEPTDKESLTVQPTEAVTPVAAPVEQVVTPPVEVAPTIAEAAPVEPTTPAPITEQAAPAEATATKQAIASATNIANQIEEENKVLEQQKKFSPPTTPTLQDARSLPDAIAKKGKTLSISGGKQEKNILDPKESKKRFDEIGYERQALELPEDMNDRVSGRYGNAIANIKSLYSLEWLGAHFHGGVAVNPDVKGTQRGRIVAHELGHASHSLLGDKINKDQNVLNELQAIEELLYPGLRAKVSAASNPDASFFNYLLSPNELIAEFNVERVSNPERAAQVAPALSALLESAEKMKGLVADRKTFPTIMGVIRESKERLKVKDLESRKIKETIGDVLKNKSNQLSNTAKFVINRTKQGELDWAKIGLRNLKRQKATKEFAKRTAELTGNQELIDYVEELYPAEAAPIEPTTPAAEQAAPAEAPAPEVAPIKRDVTKPEQMTPEEIMERYPFDDTELNELINQLQEARKEVKKAYQDITAHKEKWDLRKNKKGELTNYDATTLKTSPNNKSAIEEFKVLVEKLNNAKNKEFKIGKETGNAEKAFNNNTIDIKNQHKDAIKYSLSKKQPVSSVAIDNYNQETKNADFKIVLPEGYTKQGDLYVYQPATGKPKLGEKGGVLIPTKEDFIQAGQNIYEAGMEFGAWAKQMIQRFGDAVREFLGEVWQAVSGIPAKIEELAGYLPGKGKTGAVSLPRYKKKAEVAGEAIGKVIDTPKGINKITEDVIRKSIFNSDIVDDNNTKKAWNIIQKVDENNPESSQYISSINKVVAESIQEGADEVVKAQIGGSKLRNELFKYAFKLTAQGDSSMLNYLLENPPAIMSGGSSTSVGQSLQALSGLRSWIVQATESEKKAFYEIAASRFFDTKSPTEDQVNKIQAMFEAVKKVKIDQEQALSDELEQVSTAAGVDVTEKINQEVEKSVPRRDPWLVAFEILRKEVGEPLAGFAFKPFTMAEEIKKALIPKLANYQKMMAQQGAKGLESTFWKTMADTEDKPGPLAEVDAAINRNLAAIVKDTLIKLGMKGEPPNTKMTLIEQVANILTNQKLTQEKMLLADKRISAEIERRRSVALEEAGENQYKIDAVEAEYNALQQAWDMANGDQLNLPVSNATLNRLVSNEMKEAKITLAEIDKLSELEPNIAQSRKQTIVNSIINKLYGLTLKPTDKTPPTKEEIAELDRQVKEISDELENDKKRGASDAAIAAREAELEAAKARRDAEKKRAEIPKRDYDNLSKALMERFDAMIADRRLKLKMAKAVRDAKAEENKPDKQAESQIKRLAKIQSDTQEWAESKKDEVRAIVQNDLKNQPDLGRKEPWKAMLVGQLKGAGVSDTQAETLADLVWNQHEKNALNREMKALSNAVEKGPIKGIVQAILNTPLSEQQKPNWRQDVIKKYLVDAGVPSAKADNIAKLFDISLQKRFAEAQVKAAEKAIGGIKSLKPNSKRALEKFIKAIRAQAINPGTDAAKEFGKQMGWTGFTTKQITEIAENDSIIQSEETTDAEKAVAIEKIQKIVDQVSLPPRVREAIGSFYIGNVLLRLTTFASQLTPAAYKLADTAMESIYGLTNPQLAWIRWGEFFQSFIRAARETIFSFNNDISRSGSMVEYLDNDDRLLKRIIAQGQKQWNAGDYRGAMKNYLYGYAGVTYRILNALDDGMNSFLKEGYLVRYMDAGMKAAKIPKGKRIGTIREILSARQQRVENLVDSGISRNDANVYANEEMFSTVTEKLAAVGLNKTQSQEIVDSAVNDAIATLGKTITKKDPITGKEIEVENIGTPITKYTMQFYKYMAKMGSTETDKTTKAAMKVMGRMMVGFVVTVARESSRALGYFPLTVYRHFITGRYPLTYGTMLQRRQRIFEQMAFTIAMSPLIFMAYRTFTGDDDEEKKKGINIYFTGMGPSKKIDPEVYAQWDKKYDRGTMVIEIDGKVVYTLDSKTSGPLAPYIYAMGSIDDWKWRAKNKLAKLDDEDGNKVANAIELGTHLYDLSSLFVVTASKRSQFTGLLNSGLTNIRNSDDPIPQIMRDISFKFLGLVPVLGAGITDNLSDVFSQPIDNKTTKGAILSNTPIFGPLFGKPAFNAYGQQLGELNVSEKMKKSFGIPLTSVKLKNENDEKINFITLSKGEGPTPLTMAKIEKEMETPITEEEWEVAAKTYGKSNYNAVLEKYEDYKDYTPKEFADELKSISSDSFFDAVEAIEKMREKKP